MAPIQILLASDAPEDEIWIQRSLTLAYPEIQLVRTADPNQFLATLRTGVFHLIIVRADLVWFDRAKTLQAVQEVPLRPQVVYLTEPDDAVPELMRSPHETEVYVMRTSEPTHALAPVVHQVLRRITEPALKRPDGPFDFLPVGWFRMDEQGHLLEANSGLVSMLSYGAEKDLQSLSLADLFFSPQEFLRLQAEMSGLEGLDAFETQFACRGGSRLWVQLSLRRLTNGEETLTGWEGTVENISAQKNLAQSLREAEQFFQTILSSIQEGVVFYD
ncbi:MAG TPA: PAS domain-containing protein, partial [Anaerolineales bacterium]|nr:PAS domain-containing protein [Anaerolineales bacterium]